MRIAPPTACSFIPTLAHAASEPSFSAQSSVEELASELMMQLLGGLAQPTPAASKPPLSGATVVDVLAPELLIEILDRLSPLEQTAAALSCKKLAQASDSSCLKLVEPKQRTMAGGRSDWGRQFKSLHSRPQQKLREMSGPLPDIYANLNEVCEKLGVVLPKLEFSNTSATAKRYEFVLAGTSTDAPAAVFTLQPGERCEWYLPDGWDADKLSVEMHHEHADGVIVVVPYQRNDFVG